MFCETPKLLQFKVYFCDLSKKEGSLVSSYSKVSQGNKCPHGLPVGTCPICSGMGGGGKTDRNTPRKAGEMSYNECLAQWAQIKAANARKEQAKLDQTYINNLAVLNAKLAQAFDKISEKLNNLTNLIENAKNIPTPIKTAVNFVIKNVIMPVLNFISKIPDGIKNIQQFYSNVKDFINSVGEKLASVFGEAKNFINSAIEKTFKKPLKIFLSLFSENTPEEDEEVQKLKAREIKKVLKSLFGIKRKGKKEEENELV